MTVETFMLWIVVGLVAGWLASAVVGGGMGLVGDIVVGIVGAFLGGFIFRALNIHAPFHGIASTIVVAFVGAIVLLSPAPPDPARLDAQSVKARRPSAIATRAPGRKIPLVREECGCRCETNQRKVAVMKKFLVLYRAPVASFDQMMKATPEQQKAGMDAWMAWGKKAEKSIVDMGAPLGKALKVSPAGSTPTRNDLGGFSIMQGESKEAVAELMKGHPHFMAPDGFIEITEMMPIPG